MTTAAATSTGTPNAASNGTAHLPTAAELARPGLLAEVDRIKERLRLQLGLGPVAIPAGRSLAGPVDVVAARLGLSRFERDVLLLAAAVELDGEVAGLVSRCLGGEPRPTFALAMAVLPEPHWDALAPERPLRRWGLVTLAGTGPVATRPLSIDEHLLHTITGLVDDSSTLDGLGVLRPVPGWLTPTQAASADELAATAVGLDGPILVRLDGDDRDAQVAVAERVANRLGLVLLTVRDAALVETDLTRTAMLLDREAILADRLVLTSNERLLALLQARVVVALGEVAVPDRTVLARRVDLPTGPEQVELWSRALAHSDPDVAAASREVAHHYRLPTRSIEAIAGEFSVLAGAGAEDLRRLTRERARVGLGGLAELIEPKATWADLVLPQGQLQLLGDLARQVRHRSQVYDEWGFALRSNRGLGITALFAGESGTGKTMAAEVIAGDLGLDLYRIDLSAVVSKYIGETEKNLRKLFDAAEAGGAVLLFDEADALFGKRSDVKDSHDRYANLEVAYLLQRMEAYRGLAVLTTNLGSNVDRAFLRRLRFVIQFHFPDQDLRTELWRRVFPAQTPTQGLDPDALSRLQASGGSIHAMAVSAAFAAAAEGSPVRPEHVLHAAKVEYAKAERTLTATETAGLGGAR
jgi:vesicle-fusing ATPase